MFKIALAFALLAVAFADVSQFYRPRPAVPARKVQPTYQYKPATPFRSAVPNYAPVITPTYTPVRAAVPKYAPVQVARVSSGPVIGIVRQDSNVQPDGSYSYLYETENGIHAQEQGSVHQVGQELAKAAQGSYSYISPEGEQVSISYVADENGFQPQGSHIPVAPPVPEAILRALAYNAAHPQQETAYASNNRRY